MVEVLDFPPTLKQKHSLESDVNTFAINAIEMFRLLRIDMDVIEGVSSTHSKAVDVDSCFEELLSSVVRLGSTISFDVKGFLEKKAGGN